MTIPIRKLLYLLLLIQVLLPGGSVQADTGPKPSMDFQFVQGSSSGPVTIVSGVLYECDQPDCSDGAPLEEIGPQGFYCESSACYATGYGFAPYHRIEIEFSDGIRRESNIFETAGFNSRYTVTIRPSDLLVEALPGTDLPVEMTGVLLLCACLLCGGVMLLVVIVLFIRRSSGK